MISKKDIKGEGDDDDDEKYTLTPNTEDRYRRIDQEYARVMTGTQKVYIMSFYQEDIDQFKFCNIMEVISFL